MASEKVSVKAWAQLKEKSRKEMHGEHGVEWQHTFLYIPLSLSHFLIQSLLPAILYDLYLLSQLWAVYNRSMNCLFDLLNTTHFSCFIHHPLNEFINIMYHYLRQINVAFKKLMNETNDRYLKIMCYIKAIMISLYVYLPCSPSLTCWSALNLLRVFTLQCGTPKRSQP